MYVIASAAYGRVVILAENGICGLPIQPVNVYVGQHGDPVPWLAQSCRPAPARTVKAGYTAFSSSRRIVSPMTRVDTRAVLGWTMSLVRTPAASARRTALSTRSASSARSNE